ncbi:MAG TPA: cellulase family glycosylhydrolase [Chloroflexota bacterium]|nr:cellulase family glycosylhydrolase [Chloroflexota bacterium]
MHPSTTPPGRYAGRRLRLLVQFALPVALLAAAVAAQGGSVNAAGAAGAIAQSPNTGFSVAGNRLDRNGRSFMAHGLNLVAAAGWAQCGNAQGNLAARNFDRAELTALIRQWHANLVRFLIPQPSLAAGDKALLDKLKWAVGQLEQLHLGVILAMQAEPWSCGDGQKMPTQQTVAAWQFLAPAFGGDRNVMFELFNEPRVNTSAKGWRQWRNGCADAKSCAIGSGSVGMQTLVDVVRASGASNVLIADGPAWAESLHGITVKDPVTGQNSKLRDAPGGSGIVYAEHPYSTYLQSRAAWQHNFGFLTSSSPVLVTEWNFKQNGCSRDRSHQFFSFLYAHHIGLVAFAMDAGGTTTVRIGAPWNPNHWRQWAPTSCQSSHLGSGLDTVHYFHGLATRQFAG